MLEWDCCCFKCSVVLLPQAIERSGKLNCEGKFSFYVKKIKLISERRIMEELRQIK